MADEFRGYAPRLLLHVGELEQLEKDLEKRRAPCAAGRAVAWCGERHRRRCHSAATHSVTTPLLSGAAVHVMALRTFAAAVGACVHAIL